MPLVEVRPGCRDRGLGAGKPGWSESLILSGRKEFGNETHGRTYSVINDLFPNIS